MGKRGGANRVANTQSGAQNSITMRGEISSAKKQNKASGANLKSVLRHDHLKNLAVWAATEAPIPSLAAFLGHRLAADGEAAGIAPEPQLFSCQRCETILQPGFNCTVRIEKNSSRKRQRRRKHNVSPAQNNVVYNCHFCSHKNVKRGTTEGHMKSIYPTKPKKPPPLPKRSKTRPQNECGGDKEKDAGQGVDSIGASPAKAEDDRTENNEEASTPGPTLLLERSKRKRKRGSGKPVGLDRELSATGSEKTVGGSSKRKRNSWTSLKEIAEQDKGSSLPNIKIPFLL